MNYTQNWVAGAFNVPGDFQTTAFGGSDTPISGYPTLAAGENIKTVAGAGPGGANIIDVSIFDHVHFTGSEDSGVAILGIGDLPSGRFDATKACFKSKQFISSSYQSFNSFSPVIFITDGLFSFNELLTISIGFSNTWELFYNGFGGSSATLDTAPASLDNAWHDLQLEWQCAVPNPGFTDSDTSGHVTFKVDGVVIYDVQNIKLFLNSTQHDGLNNTVWGFWLGYFGLIGPVAGVSITNSLCTSPITANIPVGSLAFSGFGDAPMKFHAPDGTELGAPPSAPNCGPGCNGIIALKPGNRIPEIGGFGPPTNPPSAVMVFDTDFSVFSVATGGHTTGASNTCIARDDTGHFYGRTDSGTGSAIIRKFDENSNEVASWTVPVFESIPGNLVWVAGGIAVNGAGTILYYSSGPCPSGGAGGRPETVHAWDLVGNSSLGVFVTESGFAQLQSILALSNGDVLIGWHDVANVVAGFVKHYSAGGTVLHTYSLPGTDASPIYITPGVTDASFWVNHYASALSTSTGAYVTEVGIGAGTVLHSFAPDDGAGFEYDGSFCVLRAATGVTTPPLRPVPLAVKTSAAPIPCIPSVQTNNGGRGKSGCNIGGTGWTPLFSGAPGTVPMHADPTPGELLNGKIFDAWVELDVQS
jgi:hypothetical protein